jgi:hypothetical protein
MISAHSAREKKRLKMKAGRKEKGKREEEREEQAEAAPCACKGHKVVYRSKVAGFIAAPRFWAFGVRVRVRKAPVIAR